MMPNVRHLAVVDDDLARRRTLCSHVGFGDWSIHEYSSIRELLAASALAKTNAVLWCWKHSEAQIEELAASVKAKIGFVSILVLAECSDLRAAVSMMQQGVFAVLEWPANRRELYDNVQAGMAQAEELRSKCADVLATQKRFESLTGEEQAIVKFLVDGATNKAMAYHLDMSMRTVDRRRRAVLEKMNVRNASVLASQLGQLEFARRIHLLSD
ncbi:MAG: hypothetical protein KDA42_04690 [Planctomycetales bacterium]|nr:hypothetical protein [Planctomycetales bacterium]